jgi:hypothetical protein
MVVQLIISLNQAGTLTLESQQMKLEKEVFKRLCKTIGFMCEVSPECQDAIRDLKLF